VFLDDKPGQSKKELMAERDLLIVKIETLEQEIVSLRSVSESKQLSELKTKLAQSEQVRAELERDRLQFNADKDREMDRLHKQLSEARQSYESRELEHLSLVKKLECENSELREEFSIRIKEKNSKIVALEQTLAAQEQVVGNMSNEMDQLQNGMERIAIQRRAEIEELQQELMDYTTKSTRLEREVMALSMKLEDKKLKHKAEMAKMKDKIAALESEPSLERVVRHDKHDVKHELEEKNEHLKWLVRSD
jgi:chromosome segregation ATPase